MVNQISVPTANWNEAVCRRLIGEKMSDINDGVTSQPVEGNAEGTAPQVTDPTPQGTEQPQETGVTSVESNAQPTSSAATERPKVSEFYRERNRLRRLEAQIREFQSSNAELKKQLEKMTINPSVEKAEQSLTPEQLDQEYWKNPLQFQLNREKKLRDELEKKIDALTGNIQNEIPKYLEQTASKREFERQNQEALDILFPKSNSNKNLSDEERIASDPEKLKLVGEIIEEWDLKEMLQKSPLKAAKMINHFIEQKTKKPLNPASPKKSQLSTTTSGGVFNPSSKRSIDELKAEINKLHNDFTNNPSLRFDEKYQQRRKQVQEELNKLVKELSAAGA